jgi:ABC-type transport system involved in multi-copper enzyme maturation permease subunit
MTLFGPVFHKELLELSRRRSTYFLRAAMGFGLLLIFLIFANEGGFRSVLSTARKQAAIAANVYENWAWYQFWIVCGVMPLLTCGLIAAERETGALPLLFTTHLTNREIILGKLASRLVVVFLLSFSALPALVLLGLLGGVDLERLFKIYLMTFAAAVLAASIGVWLSTTAKRPWVACIQTYATLGVLWGFTPFATLFGYSVYLQATGSAMRGPPSREFLSFIFVTGPYLPIYMLTEQQTKAFFAGLLDWEYVFTYVSIWLGAATVFLFLAMHALRKDLKASIFTRAVSAMAGFVLRPVKNAATKSFGIQSALFWRLRFSGFAIFEGNPIVWRDRRADVYDPDGNILRLQVFLWIFAVPLWLLFSVMDRGSHQLFGWLISIEIALLHVMLAVVGASSIVRERQRGSLDVMLLSKMPSWSIIFGTIQGVFWTCTPTLILIASTLAMKSWSDRFPDSTFEWQFLLLTLCYTAVIVVASVIISAAASKTNHAITAAVVIGLFHWFWPLPVGMGWALLGSFPDLLRESYLLVVLWFYVILMVGSLVVGFRLLRTHRPFPAAVAVLAAVPALVLYFAPNDPIHSDATLFLRWTTSLQQGNWDSRMFHSGTAKSVAFLTAASYAVATALMLGFVVWKGDCLFGRMQSRQRPQETSPRRGGGRRVMRAGWGGATDK